MTDTTTKDLMKRIDRAMNMVGDLCKPKGSEGSRNWTMSIPARPDYDPDLVIADGLLAGKQAIERLTASAPVDGDLRPTHIKLLKHEIQSNYDRVQWAEGLIKQLPETHEGRNSWLLNYEGEKHKADKVSLALLPARTPEPDADVMEKIADAVDAARYEHPDYPRVRPWTFKDAPKDDRVYAFRLARAALAAANLLRTPAERPDREAVERIASKLDQLEEYLIGKDLDFQLPHGDADFSPSIIADEVRALALYPAAQSEAEAVREACAKYHDNLAKSCDEAADLMKGAEGADEDDAERRYRNAQYNDLRRIAEFHRESATSIRALPPAPARGGEQVSHDGEGPAGARPASRRRRSE
jgi:hypothetical protein